MDKLSSLLALYIYIYIHIMEYFIMYVRWKLRQEISQHWLCVRQHTKMLNSVEFYTGRVQYNT